MFALKRIPQRLKLYRHVKTFSSNQDVIQVASISYVIQKRRHEINPGSLKQYQICQIRCKMSSTLGNRADNVDETNMAEGKTNKSTVTTTSKISDSLQFYRRVLPEVCIGFGSEEGKKVFREALSLGYMEGYFGLAAQFRTQDEPAFCGLSSLVMALNTLEVDPKRVWKGVWRWYHEFMLDCCVPLKVVESKGVTLEQLACIASCNTLNVQVVYGKPPHTEEDFRQTVQTVVQTTNQVLIVSYSRPTLQQTGDGHFSPIAGYHPERDLVLILDTARFKYPPYWVHLPLLWDALKALDKETGQPRGYMIVSKNETSPLVVFRISPLLSVNAAVQSDCQNQVSAFLDTWHGWLRQEFTSQSDVAIWQVAIDHLVKSLSDLNRDVLITQNHVNCKLSEEHTCAVKELQKSLENSSLFHIVKEHLNSAEFIDRKGLPVMEKPNDKTRTPQGSCSKCDFPIDIKDEHYVTMLLLAWPYAKCKQSYGMKLAELASQQAISAGIVLQNEVSLLRQQLESVLGLMQKCLNCNCR